jgi:hypothetical protein
MKTFVILSTFLSLTITQVFASEHIRVSLDISAADAFKAEISSSLSRELRKFEDVDIADRDVDYQISVVALQLSPSGGYVCSVVVTSPFTGLQSDRVLKYAVMMVAHFVQADPQLQRVSKHVAAELDSEVFETSRKAQKMFRESTPTPSPSPSE